MNFPELPPTDTGSLAHLIVVMTVVLCATALRLDNALDTPTLGTVYGAAMGYATGLTARTKTGK